MKEILRKNKKRGVLLLISILISTVVLTLALALASVTFRQLELAAGAKPANSAFYAADAGVNCALFWDLRHPLYDESIFKIKNSDSAYTYTDPSVDPDPVSCYNFNFAKGSGNTWAIRDVDISPNDRIWETDFSFKLHADQAIVSAPCVSVTVRKELTGADNVIDPGEIDTRITATGYSSCDASDARRAQRVVEQTYR